MRVLVLGGSKLIGFYLLPLLVEAGHDVTVITRGNRPLPCVGVRHLHGDRSVIVSSPAITGDFDAVIDNVAYFMEDCKQLLESLQGRIRHYVVTSTAFVYPAVQDALHEPFRPLREDDFVATVPSEQGTSCETGDCKPLGEHDKYVRDKQGMESWLCHQARNTNWV